MRYNLIKILGQEIVATLPVCPKKQLFYSRYKWLFAKTSTIQIIKQGHWHISGLDIRKLLAQLEIFGFAHAQTSAKNPKEPIPFSPYDYFRNYSRFATKKSIFLKIFLKLTVSDYIKQLLSYEEYSFSLEEVTENSSKDATAVRRELNRLIEKKDIINLRKGFYLIIPPRYSNTEKLPVQLYAEKLFKYLNRNYYVALYSAAKIHGASHQQTQRDYLITETPKLNAIKKKKFDIQFHTTSKWPKNNIETKKSDAGIYKISSPALTFMDLIHHHTKIGGLNHILASLEELTEELKEHDFATLLSWYNNKSSMQRAGFLLEELIGTNSFADMIYDKLKQQPFYPILLTHKKNQKPGSVNNQWKVDVNLKMETDL